MTDNITSRNNYTSFGGEITVEDFNTYIPSKKRISNQIDANNLPKQITNKLTKKNEEEKFRNMTLEELRELKLISNTNGRPTSDMTDDKWQKEFNLRKLFITPYPSDIKKLKGKYSKESGYWNEETMGTYHGATNWQNYCSFIIKFLSGLTLNHYELTCY